ncbi:cupin domain-containing protein [Limibacter armeniacum]|uniref:cupin domain-containing protein n=1 Tax=Limibacter armeniacum TaxID=466084 RepID=UPI002FE65741
MDVEVRQLSEVEMAAKNISQWPTKSNGVSKFPHFFEHAEACYVIEGEATVTSEEHGAVKIKKGDYVVFPKGMECYWEVTSDFKKYYHIDES